MGKRLLWSVPGWAVGLALMFALRYAFGFRYTIFIDQLPWICGLTSLWLAERKGKAPRAEEIAPRPISLFGDQYAHK